VLLTDPDGRSWSDIHQAAHPASSD
jgi:hypothetical protein